jgi:hypothetical protein
MVMVANRSKFPQEIDSFVELYDIPPSLMAKAKRYQELKMKPSLTSMEQNELNQLSNELGHYIITPETWNKFADAVVNVETFFKEEVDGYIDQKQSEWANYVKDFRYVGVHDENKTYKFQNMVQLSEEEDDTDEGGTLTQGDLYLALRDVPKGVKITNTSYWQKISAKGDKGDVGLNTHLKGRFNTTLSYQVGDAVTFEGNLYFCIKDTTAGIDPTNSSYWFLYDRTIVSKTKPTTPQQGLLWIEIED